MTLHRLPFPLRVVDRLITAEARHLANLILVLGSRRHGVGRGVAGFGYVKGAFTVPLVLTGISVVEVVVLHLLIPWQWLRVVLLIATTYSVLLILGMAVASRAMNPHLVGAGEVTLKWGDKTVLTTPLSNIAEVRTTTDYRHSYVAIEGRQLVLTPTAGANVLIRLAAAVPVAVPLPKRQIPTGFQPDAILLYVSDPDAFVARIHERTSTPGRTKRHERRHSPA